MFFSFVSRHNDLCILRCLVLELPAKLFRHVLDLLLRFLNYPWKSGEGLRGIKCSK